MTLVPKGPPALVACRVCEDHKARMDRKACKVRKVGKVRKAQQVHTVIT